MLNNFRIGDIIAYHFYPKQRYSSHDMTLYFVKGIDIINSKTQLTLENTKSKTDDKTLLKQYPTMTITFTQAQQKYFYAPTAAEMGAVKMELLKQ